MTREQLRMIVDDPKAFLSRGQKSSERIAAKYERIEVWRKRAEAITAAPKTDGSSGSKTPSKLIETSVCNIVDLEQEIRNEIGELLKIEREISAAITELLTDPAQKAVLEMRYLNRFKLEEIAIRLNYTFRWTQRLNSRALEAVKEAALRRIGNAV
jgi:DNA-directed RNA polymerase specialized sigma24 family protein